MLKGCKMSNEEDMADLVFRVLYLYINSFDYNDLLKERDSENGIIGIL